MNQKFLAEINVAPMRYDMNDNRMRRFEMSFGRVNGAAGASEGFIWRWQGNQAEAEKIFGPLQLVNISVWQSLEALKAFTYENPVHRGIMQNKARWFHEVQEPNIALWWVQPGHRPGLLEAKEKLDLIRQKGPGEAPSLPLLPWAQQQSTQQCKT